MRGLELLSPSHPPEVRDHPELAELSVQINQKWPSLPPPLPLEWTETPLVSIDSSGVPWVIAPTERDPLRTTRGGTVIPRKQRASLKRIAKLGVPFQRLAIAHELDPEGPVRHLLPELNQGPRTCTDADARTLVGDVPRTPWRRTSSSGTGRHGVRRDNGSARSSMGETPGSDHLRHHRAYASSPTRPALPLVPPRRLEVVVMLRPPPERRPVRLSKRTGRRLWIAAALDMVAIAWMIAVGSWLDHTSKITAVITLGGHHVLVMIIALAGFLMLASGAVLTNGFRYANRLQLTLITAGCVISIAALAGAISALLLLIVAALLLGFLARMFLGR